VYGERSPKDRLERKGILGTSQRNSFRNLFGCGETNRKEEME
jgi:hypothetical protein